MHSNLLHINLLHTNLLHANIVCPPLTCQPLTCQPLTCQPHQPLHTNIFMPTSHMPTSHILPLNQPISYQPLNILFSHTSSHYTHIFPPSVSHSHFPPATSLALDPHVCPPHVPHSPCFPILVTHAPFCFSGTTARSLESSPLEWARRMERQVVQRCRWRQARHIHMAGAMSCDQRGDVHGGCAV